MSTLRSLATVLGFAAMTTAAVVTVFWPKATLADGDDAKGDMALDGTKVNHVVVTADLVKDAKAKTGWVMEVKAENRGNEAETAELEADLTRQVSNPMSRAAPMPTAVFKKKESITVAAGETVTRRYDVPAQFAAQITAVKKAEAAREKLAEQGKLVTMPRSITYFGVALKGTWAGEPNEAQGNRRLAMIFRK